MGGVQEKLFCHLKLFNLQHLKAVHDYIAYYCYYFEAGVSELGTLQMLWIKPLGGVLPSLLFGCLKQNKQGLENISVCYYI